MSEVKWIKITTDIFDDEKVLLIEALPEADAIIVIWFKLLCLAGKQNNCGVFVLNNRIAYTDKMLATIFRRKEATVRLALQTFEELGMIEIVDGVITIPNWEKHQNIDGMERIREQNRQRVAKYREKQKMLLEDTNTCNVTCNATDNVTVTRCNAIDKDKDKDKEYITISKEIVCNPSGLQSDVQQVKDAWNALGLKQITAVGADTVRGSNLRARLNQYGLEKVIEAINKIKLSDFLRGQNKNGWIITFDWFVKPTNFLKVLEGNYDNRASNVKQEPMFSKEFWDDVARSIETD